MRENIDYLDSESLTGMGKHIAGCVVALLLSIVIGCASTPKPVIIRHESTPSQSDAAMTRQQSHKETVKEVKQRNVSQTEEVTPALAQPEALTTEDTGTTAVVDARAAQEAHEKELIDQITAQVTEDVRKKVEEEVRRDVMNELYREVWKVNWALKEKDQRLRFGGDIRLRYETDRFDPNNALLGQPSNPSQQMNTQNDTSRFKYRVRFGAEAKVNEQTDAVIRLSTGTTSNPVSENITMGTYMNKGSAVFDLAYIKWRPWEILTLYGGRMPNPWLSSDLVWAADLNFEGFAVKVKNSATEFWSPFLTAGAFPLQQFDFSAHNKWLLAGQTGLESMDKKGVSVKIGAAYYDFKNITGVPNSPGSDTNNWTAPLFQQKGNTLFDLGGLNSPIYALASEFKELNFTGILDIGFWDPVHIVFLGDYVQNLGFDQDKVNALVGDIDLISPGFQAPPKETKGYQIGMSVGYPKIQDFGQWNVSLNYKYLEADAVVDAFTDPDFHLGGTNAKGWIVGADVGLAKNYWLRARWLTSNEISGPPLAIDVLQLDFNARF